MREIITLQIGPFANWAGSHFWNVQDDARHPPSYDENGDPVLDEFGDSQATPKTEYGAYYLQERARQRQQ
jgi:hypothetical protein